MSLIATPENVRSIAQTAQAHRELTVALDRKETLNAIENSMVITGFHGAFKIEFTYKTGSQLVTNMYTAITEATCEANIKLKCVIDQELIGATLTSFAGDNERLVGQATRFMDTLGEFMLHITKREVSPEDPSVRKALIALIDATGHVCDSIASGAPNLLPMNVSSAAHKAIGHKNFRSSGVARVDNIVDLVSIPAAAAPPAQAKNPFDSDDLIDFGAPAPNPFSQQLPVTVSPFNPFA